MTSDETNRPTEPSAPSPAGVEVTQPFDGDVEEAYTIGVRDGYEDAIQDIDIATGGDGEFRGSTIPGETIDVPAMKARIIERFASLTASLDQATRRAEEAEAQRDAMAKVIDPHDNRPALMARIIMASIERLVRAEAAEQALKQAPDARHFQILAEAMAEVKATSDGLSDQPIADIVAGCIDEIEALSSTASSITEKKETDRENL